MTKRFTHFFDPGPEIAWLLSSLGLALDYLSLRIDKEIRLDVDRVAANAADLRSVFESVSPSIESMVGAGQVALFTISPDNSELQLEGWRGSGEETGWRTPTEDAFRRVAIECLRTNRISLQPRGVERSRVRDAEEKYWPFAAVPVRTAAGQVGGILVCKRDADLQTSRSFSSTDLRTLETFGRGIAPYLERFLRLRSSSTLVEVLKALTKEWSAPSDIATALQGTIDTIARELHADIGSIFLLEQDGERRGKFILRAATQKMKHLIGHAEYSPGEGLTGTVAQNRLLHFRSWKERAAYPGKLGKYNREIWGNGSRAKTDTFLGVPIELEGNVIGVWKIENISPTEAHPDPFFTDEDIRLAQVVSGFLAYALAYRNHEEEFSKNLRQLAESTIGIARSPSEDDAIDTIMESLAKSSIPALLSLYDESTQTIRGRKASGPPWTLCLKILIPLSSPTTCSLLRCGRIKPSSCLTQRAIHSAMAIGREQPGSRHSSLCP
jgi:GAF domain